MRHTSVHSSSRSLRACMFGLVIPTLLGLFVPTLARADDWPQWLGAKRDGIWREQGIVNKLPKGGPKVRWRVPVGGGYSGPAVADGRVFITDRKLAANAKNPRNPFDTRTRVAGKERVLCINDKDGKVIWQKEYDCTYQVSYASGPRCTPVVAGDKVYTLGTMGHLYCWNVKDGKEIWHHNLAQDYNAPIQQWGFSGHPLVDGNRLICLVGGKNSLVVAFDKDSGKELWRALDVNSQGYCPPMIYTIGGKRQLIMWHPKGIHSLNPTNGKVNWYHRYPRRGQLKAALSIPTPRYDNGKLFVTAFYDGPLMIQINDKGTKTNVLWQGQGRNERPDGTDGLHSIMATPFIKDGYIYGVCSYGELRCLNAKTGKRIWSSRQPTSNGKELRWANAFLVQHEDRFFLFNELGDLIIAKLTPNGYEEISRANVLRPTNKMAGFRRPRLVLWSHPAFANRCMYARNDEEIVCVSLAAK